MTSALSRSMTNIAYVPLRSGTDIEDPTTPEGKAWRDALDIIRAQYGYQQSSYGKQLESPDTMMWLIDWASMAAYIGFTKSPDYPKFMQGMEAVLASPPQLYHFFPNSLPPHIPLSTAPYTEVTTFYNTTYSPDFRQNVERFVKVLDEGKVEGYLGVVYGDTEVIGERVIDSDSAEVKKASRTVMCVGWKSTEHHLKFQEENPLFKENIWLLREGSPRTEVTHVLFKIADREII